MSALPPGWELAPIVDLIATDGLFVDGDWVESKDQDPAGEVRLTQLADVGEGRWRNRSDRYLTAADAERLRCTDLQVDDVLVARMPDPLGRACLFPGDPRRCVTVVDVAIIRPGRGSVDPRWIMYAINAPQARTAIESMQSGTTRKRISRKNLGTVELPVAPRAEQSRIVAAIEEAFSKLDAGEAGLWQVRQRLRRMRDAVLAAAVSGRLVPQDPADDPAAKLLADLGAEADEISADAPRGWSLCRLGAITELQEYGVSLKAHEERTEGDIPILRMGNIRQGRVEPGGLKYVPLRGEGVGDRMLRDGDLLFNRTNSFELVGKSAVYHGFPLNATFASYLIRVRTRPGVEAEWCAAVINSPVGRRYIEGVAAQQVGQANVNGTKLKQFPIPLPPHAEQRRILKTLEAQMSFIEACERSVSAGLKTSAALRRSVLRSAFEGRLVPQDPTDEPASVLLERIRAERAAAPTPKKRRAKATA